MRIALISDIHGNLVSLNAVLADIEQRQVNQIICLGDIATLGPQPAEVMARIRQLGCTCIMGNHDEFLIDPNLIGSYTGENWLRQTIEWCINQLPPEDIEFVRTFRPSLEVPLNETNDKLLCYHGSPRSNTDLLLAITPPTNLDVILSGYKATIMAGGHTHIQMLRQHKGTLVVNSGSIGMPFEQAMYVHAPRFLPWAEYAILNYHNGHITIELCRVAVQMEKVLQAGQESNLPGKKDWLRNWVT